MFKKLSALCLTVAMACSMGMAVFAEEVNDAADQISADVTLGVAEALDFDYTSDEIPPGFPEGTVKVADGIYAYTRLIMPMNITGELVLGTVPSVGTIIQPSSCSNIRVDSGHNWLEVQADNSIRINFVAGTQTVFGSNVFNWPSIGGSFSTVYSIHAPSYNIQTNTAYQLQCTSINDLSRKVNRFLIKSVYK